MYKNFDLQLVAIISVLLASPSFYKEVPFYWVYVLTYAVFVYLIFAYSNRTNFVRISNYGKLYLVSMLAGALFHFGNSSIEYPMYESLRWIVIILLIFSFKNQKKDTKFISAVVIAFYLLECFVCIGEQFYHDYLINYSYKTTATALDSDEYSLMDFRSRALLLHPLFNANVLAIYIAFFIFSDRFHFAIKWFFVCLGFLAILACNSRASIVIVTIILLYRFFLYRHGMITVFIGIVLFYFLFPIIIDFIQMSDMFGRLSGWDFTDASSMTRFMAYHVFSMQDWDLYSILFGCGYIYYPGTNVTLENGILLNLGYWGWIVGTIKTITEVLIAYSCLKMYSTKEKIVILFATFGIASANNNITMPFLMAFFMVIWIGLRNDVCVVTKK